jgi:cellulose synthase/poly-beta-1,6-N-acetylglucosamine synthase-like glycosyltransferase
VYSLVIPAYNEEEVIDELVKRVSEVMDALDGDAEAILVDDGSSRRDEPGIRFHLASSERYPYYVWGLPWMLKDRLQLFARDGQVGEVLDPGKLGKLTARGPFALLISREAWDRFGRGLAERYPSGRMRNVQPDGTRVVFEVPPAASS